MKNYLIFGASSNLTKAICAKLSSLDLSYAVAGTKGGDYNYDALDEYDALAKKIDFKNYDNIIINIGFLQDKTFLEQAVVDHVKSLRINLLGAVNIAENALQTNENVKICIIGSESAKKGSYDLPYFLSKAALEAYIRERRIKFPAQRIFGVSPSTIGDAGMTLRRKDNDILNSYRATHPKERFATCAELSEVVIELFTAKFCYLTNDTLEINGGKFARMQT